MNLIEDIEIREENNLEYSLKFTLNKEGNSFPIIINKKYDSEESRIRIRIGLSNWKKYFSGWIHTTDDKISIDLSKPIGDYHLIFKNNKIISIYDVASYFDNL